jgi:hypothetical protein
VDTFRPGSKDETLRLLVSAWAGVVAATARNRRLRRRCDFKVFLLHGPNFDALELNRSPDTGRLREVELI